MKKSIFGVCFFMTFLTSLIAGAKEPVMFERVVQLPDAELRFSMAEDFSKDMPAAPLVEKVTIDMLQELKSLGDRFVVGRRWWDVRPPGWFKKTWGSIQMTAVIGAAIDKQGARLNFCNFSQVDFLRFYREALIERWRHHNEELSPESKLQFGVEIPSFFGAIGQRFVPHYLYKKTHGNIPLLETAAGYSGVINYYFSVPVADGIYLELEFVGAPSVDVSAYVFHDLALNKINAIKDSIFLTPINVGNCMISKLGKWDEIDSVSLLKPDPSLLPKPVPASSIEKFFPDSGRP
ncbi:MAG TPA: hypothetical protein PK129_09420 [Cellvibrionaceae bacterium]|nr:hypothetical protein [Cellvibrionaceae bacterium]